MSVIGCGGFSYATSSVWNESSAKLTITFHLSALRGILVHDVYVAFSPTTPSSLWQVATACASDLSLECASYKYKYRIVLYVEDTYIGCQEVLSVSAKYSCHKEACRG